MDGEEIDRCPVALIGESPAWVWEFFRCRHDVREHGQWPNAGGRLDQSAVFLDLMDAVDDQEKKPKYK